MNKRVMIVGALSLFVGFLIELSLLVNITGNSVLIDGNGKTSSLLGLFLMIGGVLLLTSVLEKRLEVSAHVHGKKENPEKDYHINDPELFFGSKGGITLGDFTREIQRLEKDPELLEIVRQSYGRELLEIRSSDENRAGVADAFLKVLYGQTYKPLKRENLSVGVGEDEKDEIDRAFRPGWNGRPTSTQKKVLKNYGFIYEVKSKHGCIYAQSNPNVKVSVSSTPSDPHAGRNIGRDIVKMLEDLREEES